MRQNAVWKTQLTTRFDQVRLISERRASEGSHGFGFRFQDKNRSLARSTHP
jgi:hypothetical protein